MTTPKVLLVSFLSALAGGLMTLLLLAAFLPRLMPRLMARLMATMAGRMSAEGGCSCAEM